MNEKRERNRVMRAGKECAYIAVFVALTISLQLCFSALPGVELVTVLFVSYSFVFGRKRGTVAAVAFALLRQFLFGFYPTVLLLYLLYYPLLACLFGWLGKKVSPIVFLWLILLLACLAAVCFTMLDNILTPLWYGYTKQALKAYFYASFGFMLPQVICVAISVGFLFLPLQRVFSIIKKSLLR